MSKIQVYIRFNSKFSVSPDTNVFVKDICEVYSKNKDIINSINNVKVFKTSKNEKYEKISSIFVTEKILESVKDVDLIIQGETDILIEVKSLNESSLLLNFIKVSIVCILIFFGAGMALANFHEDVGISETMNKLYLVFTGETVEEPPMLITIPYSIGIGFGMWAFFSRSMARSYKRKQEPGPLELELYLYDKDIEENIIEELSSSNFDVK